MTSDESFAGLVARYCAGDISADDYYAAVEVHAKRAIENEMRDMAQRRASRMTVRNSDGTGFTSTIGATVRTTHLDELRKCECGCAESEHASGGNGCYRHPECWEYAAEDSA